MADRLDGPALQAVRLSAIDSASRDALLRRYEIQVYGPAFPDAEIREDPAYWRGLLDADPYPPPPQPLIEVLLLVDPAGDVAGGVTIELYREANAGLLTYISVDATRRGQGLGKRLIAEARAALDRMGSPATPMFAETERLEDARDEAERAATVLRQRQLAGMGARWVEFDYVMPPLRTDTLPHRLHLMLFGGPDRVPAATILALLDELARALGTRLDAFQDTSAMASWLASADMLPVKPLPEGGRG
ncbi:GNAT family N-acetyltransferase [Sphingomonas koreensis]|uniref:GNAT family N-acetyltransferase n=1 Tax=Sphingomonas koreensis TaxID=93064 RepID=UPI000F735FF5|nr:GNAT family N-acetyltransferase [Sphingomonas koreensis]MDC7809717.1 GNAT family N-acetyltransferase [Sphingomonas koreensis]